MAADNDATTGSALRYRLLTGPDDADFCRRVSDVLATGYELYGSPTMTFDGTRVIAGQSVRMATGYPKD